MKGYSIHLGINKLDPQAYRGWEGKLNACENDACSMERIALREGFSETVLLLSSDATFSRFNQAIARFKNLVLPEDMLLITFSGHGGQIKAIVDRREKDNLDEVWCLYDRVVRDDMLFMIWKSLPPRVRVFIVSDSCHSGDILRDRNLAYRSTTREYTDQYNSFNSLECSLRLFAACKENERTKDGKELGAFTSAISSSYRTVPKLGYDDFFNTVVNRLEFGTNPRHQKVGKTDLLWDESYPFTLIKKNETI